MRHEFMRVVTVGMALVLSAGCRLPPANQPELVAAIADVPSASLSPQQVRARRIADIRRDTPDMPDDVVELFADAEGVIRSGIRCEVTDWFVDPASLVAEPARVAARRNGTGCALPIDDLNPGIVAERLAGEAFRFDIEGDTLTFLAHSPLPAVSVCCSLREDLERLGDSEFWARRIRLPALDEAILTLGVNTDRTDLVNWRGPNASPAPVQVPFEGIRDHVIEREIQSKALGETRRVTVYLPPGHTKDKSWPALFLGDNLAGSYARIVHPMIVSGAIEPIVLVSAQTGARAIVGDPPTGFGQDLRSAEYIPKWKGAGDRFDRHLEFFADELTEWASVEYGVSTDRADRAVSGVSSGGVFALWAAIRRPDVFATSIPMSPGQFPPKLSDLRSPQRARFFLSGGRYEPPFLEGAELAEAALDAAGYDVNIRTRAAGHYEDQWLVRLAEVLPMVFPHR